MPIYELGYRHWEGELTAPAVRWWAITRTGLKLAFAGKMLRRLLIVSWLPIIYYALLFIAVGYVTDPERHFQPGDFWHSLVTGLLGRKAAEMLLNHPESVRSAGWSMGFHYLYAYTQSWFTMIIVAIVGPPLIAQDVRSKAFLLYFSKPITIGEYLLGKAGVLFFFIFLVTLAPGLVLCLVSIATDPSLSVVAATGPAAFHVLELSLCIAIPSTLIMLVLSSLTSDGRYAAFGWMAIWIVGEIVYAILEGTEGLRNAKWLSLISPRKTIVVLSDEIFNVSGQLKSWDPSAAFDKALDMLPKAHSSTMTLTVLAILSVVCLGILMRRISAPVRI